MRRGSVAQLGVMGIVLCLGIPTWEAYAQSVPAPVLSQVSPDRVAVGDLFTLTGEAFAAGEAQVTVNFGSIPVTVTPDSDTQISLTVPQGATSGPVTVTTTAMANGQPLLQTSNPEDILVIWDTLDLSALLGTSNGVFGNMLLPGRADDVIATENNYLTGAVRFFDIQANGTTTSLLGTMANSVTGTNSTIDPVSGDFYAITAGGAYTLVIADQNTGHVLYQGPNPPGQAWTPYCIRFDPQGDLIVAGARQGPSWLLCLWRFAPGDPVVLDPNNAQSLMPGGVSAGWGWQGDMAVAGNGTIYAVDGDNYPGPEKLWMVPGQNGLPYETIPMPPSTAASEYPGYGVWFLAADCMGRAYAINPCLNDSNCSSPQAVYLLPDMTPVAYPQGIYFTWGFSSDAYGDLYLMGSKDPLHDYTNFLVRVLPDQFVNPNYYDTFTCCPTGVQYKDVVQKSRGETVETSCSTLTVNISQNGQTIPVTQSGQTVTLPLGATPNLALLSNGQIISSATWNLHPLSRDNPTPDPDDLFPGAGDVALLWSPNSPPAVGPPAPAQLVVLHLGRFQITATSGQNSLSFTVQTVASGALGADPSGNAYDCTIYTNAERFGIPPEYIKACIDRETGKSFHPELTRYEALAWDYAVFRTELTDPYYSQFAFDEPAIAPGVPGSPIQPGAWVNSWKDTRVKGYDQPGSGPLFSLQLLDSWTDWNSGTGCSPVTTSDTDISAHAVVLGSSAWVVPPPNPPFQQGPCGVGYDWYEQPNASYWVAVFQYDMYRSLGEVSDPVASLDYFYDHKDYNAQTVLASSYGLMQVGFEEMRLYDGTGWMPPDPTATNFMLPDQNIQVGSWVLSRKAMGITSPVPTNSLGDFQNYFVTAFGRYNGGGASYGQDVVLERAPAFEPALATQPPSSGRKNP